MKIQFALTAALALSLIGSPAIAATNTAPPGSVSMQQGKLTTTGPDSARALLTGFDNYNGLGPDNYSADLTAINPGGPVALRGWVDASGLFNTPDLYFKLNIRETSLGWASRKQFETVFAVSQLGGWYGMDPQPWQRIRHEITDLTNPLTASEYGSAPEQWYATEGGTHDQAGGGTIYPTDGLYYIQSIVDPSSGQLDLWVYGKGNGGGVAPPNSINSFDTKQWYHIGSWDELQGRAFDFQNVGLEFMLQGHSADPSQTGTVEWYNMTLSAPISTQVAPPGIVPEPLSILAVGAGLAGLGGYIRRRR
jgi:hypothetical protein